MQNRTEHIHSKIYQIYLSFEIFNSGEQTHDLHILSSWLITSSSLQGNSIFGFQSGWLQQQLQWQRQHLNGYLKTWEWTSLIPYSKVWIQHTKLKETFAFSREWCSCTKEWVVVQKETTNCEFISSRDSHSLTLCETAYHSYMFNVNISTSVATLSCWRQSYWFMNSWTLNMQAMKSEKCETQINN